MIANTTAASWRTWWARHADDDVDVDGVDDVVDGESAQFVEAVVVDENKTEAAWQTRTTEENLETSLHVHVHIYF